jgi:hypothetical protein
MMRRRELITLLGMLTAGRCADRHDNGVGR